MVFGGCKNYMGHSKSCDHNIIVFPGDYDDKGIQRGSNPCQTDDNSVFANQYHDNNHCFTSDGDFYSARSTEYVSAPCHLSCAYIL